MRVLGLQKDVNIWRRRLESRQAATAAKPSSSAPVSKLDGRPEYAAEDLGDDYHNTKGAVGSAVSVECVGLSMEISIPRRDGVFGGEDEEGELDSEANWSGPEAELISQLVRAENAELVEIVETQHACLAAQQAKTGQAEREVQRLNHEVRPLAL